MLNTRSGVKAAVGQPEVAVSKKKGEEGKGMRGAAIAGILFLFLVAWVGVACPAGGAHGPARVESGNQLRRSRLRQAPGV